MAKGHKETLGNEGWQAMERGFRETAPANPFILDFQPPFPPLFWFHGCMFMSKLKFMHYNYITLYVNHTPIPQ